MQHRIHIDAEARLAFVQLSGAVNTKDVLALTMQVLDHPDWQPGFDELWDALHVTEAVVELEEVKAALAIDKAMADWVGDGRVAAVVARDLDHTVARLYQAMSRVLSMRSYGVFWSYDEALGWMGRTKAPASLSDGREGG